MSFVFTGSSTTNGGRKALLQQGIGKDFIASPHLCRPAPSSGGKESQRDIGESPTRATFPPTATTHLKRLTMAPGLISPTALLLLTQHLHVDAFSVNGFGAVRSQTARASSTATPSMVAVSVDGKPMTQEQKRKEQRLKQERIRKYVTAEENYKDAPLSTPTGEHLIGEEMVKDDATASALADKCILEAERLFASDEGWTKVLEEDGIFVESKDVAGPYRKSGVRVVRGLGAIEADADTFYDFQVRFMNRGRDDRRWGKGGGKHS